MWRRVGLVRTDVTPQTVRRNCYLTPTTPNRTPSDTYTAACYLLHCPLHNPKPPSTAHHTFLIQFVVPRSVVRVLRCSYLTDSNLKTVATRSSETSVLTISTRRHIEEGGILHRLRISSYSNRIEVGGTEER
jgi:hypothetical protein